ncbi:TAXI family TRAP transporter solute-binding subunit [Sporosarcina sp. FSL W7-1283]|uniref:TAXI family TRAP transporter solute-binding subunit n=1 Tax=Sporosarcina sp. FSL W7-1283 TaxID=2921560 RepID=UPI0030F74882
MKKNLMSIVVLLSILLVLAACGSTETSDKKDAEGKTAGVVPLYTPGSGGTNYVIGAGISQLFNSSKEMPDVVLSTESVNGSAEILKNLIARKDKGKAAFGVPASDIATNIYEGKDPIITGEHQELRAVTWFSYAAIHIVVPENSKVKSIADLKGKKVGVAPKGSSPYNFMQTLLEDEYDMSFEEDVKVIPLGNAEISEGLQNGSIDVGILTGFIPAPLITEVAQLTDVKVIPFDESELDSFTENHPYYSSMEVKANTYKDQKEDITIGAFETMLLTHEDVDDEMVYNLTKFIMENGEKIKKVHSSFDISPENVSKGVVIPFHPGAVKYFEENDIQYE